MGIVTIPDYSYSRQPYLSLRAKLETEPARPRRLLTVHGVGYKWTVDAPDNSVKNILQPDDN